VESDKRNFESVYSKKVRAGRRRTYFFDVRTTRSNDYYITLTESKRKFDEDGYERHKLFLYKEDFNKFVEGLNDTVNYIKTELMPDYDFDEFKRPLEDGQPYNPDAQNAPSAAIDATSEVAAEEAVDSEEVVAVESDADDAVEEVVDSEEPTDTVEEAEALDETSTDTPEDSQPVEEPIDEEDLKWD